MRITSAAGTVVLGLLALALSACGSDGATPAQPIAPPTPSPPPSGTFAVVSSSPVFGSTVFGRDSDLQGTSELTVTIQTTYSGSIPSAYFVLALLNGTTECLRTQIAYCARADGGPWGTYTPGESATYRCTFFVRDNQQPTCGSRFTTNRMRFILQTRGTNDTLFLQEANGGWSFVFSG